MSKGIYRQFDAQVHHRLKILVWVAAPARNGIVALGKTHMRSAPSPIKLAKLPSKQHQRWSGWTQIVPELRGRTVDRFLCQTDPIRDSDTLRRCLFRSVTSNPLPPHPPIQLFWRHPLQTTGSSRPNTSEASLTVWNRVLTTYPIHTHKTGTF